MKMLKSKKHADNAAGNSIVNNCKKALGKLLLLGRKNAVSKEYSIPKAWKRYENSEPKYEIPFWGHPKSPVTFSTRNSRYRQENGIYTNGVTGDTATLYLTGDLMCQKIVQNASLKENGRYDFDHVFAYARDFLSEADLLVGNLETTLCEDAPFAHEQLRMNRLIYHNSPDEWLSTLAKTGFDVLVTCNNHMLDTGLKGLYQTRKKIEQCGIIPAGTYYPEEKQKFKMVEVNGIRIAILTYCMYYNHRENYLTAEGLLEMACPYDPRQAKIDISNAKASGAEFILVYLHGGKEYTRKTDAAKVKACQELADAGCDYIIGLHPHVLQPYTVLKSADGRSVPCYYSLGNFFSHQKQPHVPESAVAVIKLKKENGTVRIESEGYIPVRSFKKVGSKRDFTAALIMPYNNVVKNMECVNYCKEIKGVLGKQISRIGKVETSKMKKDRLRREKAILDVAERTGWSIDLTKKKITEACKRTHCNAYEYFIYNFDSLPDEVQEEYFLLHWSRLIREKYDKAEFVSMSSDKVATNTFLSECIHRPWALSTELDFDSFIEKFSDCKRIIAKPVHGHQGDGVETFLLNSSNMHEVYDSIKNLPASIVEDYIIQHPVIGELSPNSVNTLRFVTISYKEHGKLVVDFAYSFMRIGNGSVVDNLHAGGMAAAVDINTGIICTPASNHLGYVYEKHPLTGTQITGLVVPKFDECKNMVENSIRFHNICGYFGWDIAITPNGPDLVELNANPGADGLQIPYSPMRKGMKHIMEKYL